MDYAALIAEVKKRPELYDKASQGYFNRPAHEMAWVEIGNVVGASARDAKREWTYLRNKFQKWKTKPASPYWRPTFKKTLGIAEQYAEELDFLTEHMSTSQGPHTSTSQGPSGNLGCVTTLKLSEVENDCDGTVSDSSNDVSVASWQSRSPNHLLPPNYQAKAPEIQTPSRLDYKCTLSDSSVGVPKQHPRSAYLERLDMSKPEHPEIGWFRSLLPVIEKLTEEQKLLWKTEVQMLLSKYVGAKKMPAQTSPSDFLTSFDGNLATENHGGEL